MENLISFDQLNKINESINNFNTINQPTRNFDENQYFLLLSIYFYLKHHNHDTTAEILYEECKLGDIFIFPKNIIDDKSETEKLKKKF